MRRARIKVAPNLGARLSKTETESSQEIESSATKEPVPNNPEQSIVESSTSAESSANKPTLLQKLGRFRAKPNINPARTSQPPTQQNTSDISLSNSECVVEHNQLPCLSPLNGITEPTQISPNKPIEASLVVANVSNISSNVEIREITSQVEVQTQLAPAVKIGSQETKKGEDANEEQVQNNSGWCRLKPRVTRVKPNIEGASHRVRTFSSASESEDESRRQKLIHSASNARSVANNQSNKIHPPEREHAKEEPEPKVKKKSEERSQLDIRKEDMRKKFMKGQVELKQMTMFDLIYYNPDGERPTRSKEKLVTRRRVQESGKQNAKSLEVSSILEEKLAEEDEERRVMEQEEEEMGEGKENQNQTNEGPEDAMPVPQVRLGPNGEIILDEKSLVIETSETKRSKMKMADAPIIVENSAGLVNYGSWRTRKRSPKWTIKETARFYRALSMLGTDFSLMESLFPRRTRFELKRKFKIEEKINRPLIDRTIGTQKPFDPTVFGDETGSEDECETASIEEIDSKKRKRKKESNGTKRRRTKINSPKEDGNDTSELNQCTWSRDSSHDTTSLPTETSADSEVSSQDGQLSTLLQSPLGQMSLEKGGVTVVEQAQSSLPSFVVPPALTKENPVFANAQPGSLVVVTTPNPNDPDHQLLHVYRIATTVEQPLS